MKLSILALLVLLTAAGCQSGKDGVEISMTGTDEFPDYLVGTWKANHDGWEITFNRDGSIDHIVHTVGRVELEPGKERQVAMKMEGKSVFKPGKWEVYWDESTNELAVDIELDYFYAEIGDGVVEGSSKDVIAGEVLDDEELWLVTWTSFPDWVAHTDEHRDFDLSGDDTEKGITRDLVFRKISQK